MSSNKQKILVTGALGFLASNFIRKFTYENAPYIFVGVDKATTPAALNNGYIHRDFKFHIADLLDKHCIDRIFTYERPDIILHTASIDEFDAHIGKDVVGALQNNIIGTQNIIDICANHKIKRLVFTSSEDVYAGTNPNSDEGKVKQTTEIADINPITYNGISKVSQELLIKASANIHGLNYNIGRFCSLYGQRQAPNNFIPKIINCILNNSFIFLNGEGGAIKDWIYVSDACNALMTLIETKESGQIFNITTNQDISNIELIQKICKLLGRGMDLVKEEVLYQNNSKTDTISMDAGKIKALGWTSKIALPAGLEQVCIWYSKNQFFLK